MNEPKIAIIISSYSQGNFLVKNIESIKKNFYYKNYKIYIIDDSGKGEIFKKVKEKFKGISIIKNKKNFGFSKSYNKGILFAKKDFNPDYFLVLNDDCEFREKCWLRNFIYKIQDEKNKDIGIFGCKLIYSNGDIQWAVKKERTHFYKKKGVIEKNKEFSEDSYCKEVIGAFMLIKKEVLKKVGLFDEKFSPFYGEESDLCFRTTKQGYKIKYFGDFSLVHYGNKSISKLSKEEVWFIKKRNSIRLEWKHYRFFRNIKMTLIHLGSILSQKEGIGKIKKISLLFKAYRKNFKSLKEIREFRKGNK